MQHSGSFPFTAQRCSSVMGVCSRFEANAGAAAIVLLLPLLLAASSSLFTGTDFQRWQSGFYQRLLDHTRTASASIGERGAGWTGGREERRRRQRQSSRKTEDNQ